MVKKEKKVTRIDPVRTTQPLEQTQEKRVCAYCRISTDSEDQKHSLEAQVAYYSRLSWLERYTDNVEVGSSTLPGTTSKLKTEN